VTLIDRCNYHLFQPLLYQVATGSLSPANVAGPLRQVLRKQKNTQVLLGEAISIDAAKRQVILSDGVVDYDTLIVATGSTHQYFGHDEWEEFAPGLKISMTRRPCAGAFSSPSKPRSANGIPKNCAPG
jgi:NADH dehydrogenase